MMRIQIQLEREQHRRLRRRARELGVSISEVVRRAIDAQHEKETPDHATQRALSVVGKYADPEGGANVAVNHDAFLAEVYRR